MILIKLFNYIRGFLTITVEGYFVERFINICARRNIYLWGIKPVGVGKMQMNISIAGFKKIATIGYKTSSHIRITRRAGLPFTINRYKKRYAFAAGIVIFCLAVQALSMFIWGIEITGNDKVSAEEIMGVLKDSGLNVGMLRSDVDVDAVRGAAMTQMDSLAFIGVNIRGTKALVEVRERVMKPEIVPKDKPCHIIAARDGVIENMDVRGGEQKMKEGDVVYEGQLLVSGILDSKALGVRYIHSVADVRARTWHEQSAEAVPYIEVRTQTGHEKNKNILKIFDFKIKFFKNDSIPYANYDRISEKKQFSVGADFVLPISFHVDKYYDVTVTQTPIPLEEAVQNAAAALYEKLDMEALDCGAEVLSKNHTTMVDEDGKIWVTATYECLENIAKQEEIIYE